MNTVTKLGMAAAAALTISATVSAADTYTFKTDTIQSAPVDFVPVLDLNNATDASFSIVAGDPATSPEPIEEIKNFKIDFEYAPQISFSSLKKSNTYLSCPNGGSGEAFFGTVNNAWIFRTVEAVVCVNYFPGQSFVDFTYQLSVKDMESYTDGNPMPGMFRLVEGSGLALDTTPNKTADFVKTNYLDKTLKLTLLQRQAEAEIPNYGPRFGFVINASWLGFGDRPLVIENYAGTPSSKAIAINLTTIPGPTPEDDIDMISITFEDEFGMQQQTAETELRFLLENSYGPLPL